MLLYRGHRENVRHVQRIIQAHPRDRLGLYYDFDPQGLATALSVGGGYVFVPAQWQRWSEGEAVPGDLNQKGVFRRQGNAASRLQKAAGGLTGSWPAIIDLVTCKELAIMQEHMVGRGWELTAIPLPDTDEGEADG